MEELNNLTIVVPTHENRTPYLKRLLSFYSRLKFKGKILIGDSSEEPVLSLNKKLIEHHPEINVKQIHFPKPVYSNPGKLNFDIVYCIDTDFVCFSGDDDFHIPQTLSKCVQFLEENEDYIGTHGCKIRYNVSPNTVPKNVNISNIAVIKGQFADIDDPVSRFRYYMKSETSPQYHVTRKSVWSKIYKYSFSLPDVYFLATEVLPCSLYYIMGKVKRFHELPQYMMEQTNNPRNMESVLGLINDPGWGSCASSLKEIIVKSFQEQGVDKKVAELVFDEEFNHRVLRIYTDQVIAKYGIGLRDSVEQYLAHTIKYDCVPNLDDKSINGALSLIVPELIESIWGS